MENAEREAQGSRTADHGRRELPLHGGGRDCVHRAGGVCAADGEPADDVLRMQFEAYYNGVLTNKATRK